jgi:O-acetyl-ADP-ribose deacetylase (regulator of RNase III)/uncharacterized protein YwgA
MVKVLVGDLFESKAQTLVNTVNCIGVMGKGIALEFKKRFPAMFEDYLVRCKRREVRLGEPYLFIREGLPWILNFPTKYHWRALAKLEDITSGLDYLAAHYNVWGITSLAVPPLGAGLGQLEWRIIGPVLYSHLNKIDVPVELYAPYNTPADELQLDYLRSASHLGQLPLKPPSPEWISPPWIALVEILRRIQSHPYHWPIGRVAFQKLAYVATAKGLPLGIAFKRGSFGPFSPELKRMTSRLMSNSLIAERQSGRMFEVSVGPQFFTASQAYAQDIARWDSVISEVSDLFARTTTQQAEIIATVLYVARELESKSEGELGEAEVVDAALDWKQRRRPPLAPADVAHTARNLAALKWLDLKPNAASILPYDHPAEL